MGELICDEGGGVGEGPGEESHAELDEGGAVFVFEERGGAAGASWGYVEIGEGGEDEEVAEGALDGFFAGRGRRHGRSLLKLLE